MYSDLCILYDILIFSSVMKPRLGITPIDEIRRFDRDVSKDLLQIAAKHAKGDALSGKVASRGILCNYKVN